MHLFIVIPTYNESENIVPLVDSLLDSSLAHAARLTLVIVDDNSPDGTGQLIDSLVSKYPGRIRAMHRMSERGRASAGIAGFKHCLAAPECTHIAEMDADFSHHPDDLPALVAAIQKADVVIGSRYIRGGQAVNCRLFNRTLSICINIVNRLLFGLPLRDSSGGYKIYARKVLATINLDNFVSTAYSVGLETLLKCKHSGFTFCEVPITFRNREKGKSKMDWPVIKEYPRTVARLKLRGLQGKLK